MSVSNFLTAEEGKAGIGRERTRAQPKCQHCHCFQLSHGTKRGESRDIKEEDVLEQLDVADLDCIYSSCASSRDRCCSVIHNSNVKARTVIHFVNKNRKQSGCTVFWMYFKKRNISAIFNPHLDLHTHGENQCLAEGIHFWITNTRMAKRHTQSQRFA